MTHRIPTRDDRGFTLIELMVVVLIIAILLAIAIPTFLGAQDRARNRGAQSDLRNAMTAAKSLATDSGGYFLDIDGTELAPGDMPDVEPAIVFDGTTTTASPRVMYLFTGVGGEYVTFVQESASGTYFGITTTKDGVVTYCSGAAQADCDDGAEPLQAWATSW